MRGRMVRAGALLAAAGCSLVDLSDLDSQDAGLDVDPCATVLCPSGWTCIKVNEIAQCIDLVDAASDQQSPDADATADVSDAAIVDAPEDTSAGGGGGCMVTLHAAEGGTIYCGLVDAATLSCGVGQECCLGGPMGGGFAPDICSTWGSVCTNPPDAGFQIECEQPSDCLANAVANGICCLHGASSPMLNAMCDSGALLSLGGSGTTCSSATSCPSNGDLQICEATSDCPVSKTCTPFRWKLLQLGYCK